MLEWKGWRDKHLMMQSLEVSGPRQCGKTTVINKFAEDNYKNVIRINLGLSDVINLVDTFEHLNKSLESERELCVNFVSIFEQNFVDSPDTVIVIDEIQASPYVYNFIRPITRNLKSHLIVTGSYLGRVVRSREFFISAGDLHKLNMSTFSFEEFLDIFDKRKVWESLDLFSSFNGEDCNEIMELFNIYLRIGGYPTVISSYIKSHDILIVNILLDNLIRTFSEESTQYLTDITDTVIFDTLFEGVARLILDEKRGTFFLMDELIKIVHEKHKSLFSEKSIISVTNWLIRCGVLSMCSLSGDCDMKSLRPFARLYFTDLGLARLFLRKTEIPDEALLGVLFENFVFINLCEMLPKQKLLPNAPAFGVYGNGEIDFVVRSKSTGVIYAVEVKAGKNKSNTANALLNKGIVNKVLFVRGNTYGGVDGNKVTIPICLFGKYDFNDGIPLHSIFDDFSPMQKMTAFD
jgi:predicted AAA+ superfamily ATPase